MRYLMKLESFIENKTYIKTYEKYYDGDYEYFKNLSYRKLSDICYYIAVYLETIQPLNKNFIRCMYSSDDLTFCFYFDKLSNDDHDKVIRFIQDENFEYIKTTIEEDENVIIFRISEDKMIEMYELQSNITKYNL